MATKYPSGKEKKRLQEQLEDIEFVRSEEELQQFKCDFCQKIVLERYSVECGHGFCNKCTDDVHGRPCPVTNCHNKLIKKSTRNNDFEVGVYRLEVFCRNKRFGCEMKIRLLNYLEHENNCPVAVEMAEASGKVIKLMREEIDDLKLKMKNLQRNLTRTEENLKMNLYAERQLKTDLQLMEGKLNDIISQKMTTEGRKIEDKFGKEVQRIDKEKTALLAQVEKNFAIQQNQELGLEKQEIEKYIKDQVLNECTKGMQAFTKDVTEMVDDFARKQKHELKTTITDELIGRLAIKELDLEVKMKNEFDENFKMFTKNLEAKMTTKFEQETEANKVAFERWSEQTLNNKIQVLKKDFEKKIVLNLNQNCHLYKQELSDVMLEDLNDKLDECTKALIKRIEDELKDKLARQMQFMIEKINKQIQTKSEQNKEDLTIHVEEKMIRELATQKTHFKTKFSTYINQKMEATENEFCIHFSHQISDKMDEQFHELHSTLSEEFNNEILLMQGHIQEQYETGVQLGQAIETLDTNYVGKTEFLLDKYSTTFVWPISDFIKKMELLRSGAIREVESDNFMVKDCKLMMRAKLTWVNNHALLLLAFLPSERQSVCHHRRTVWLLDQQYFDDGEHRVRVEELHFGMDNGREWMDGFHPLGLRLFPSLEELSTSPFLKDGTVVVKILIEPLAILYKSIVSNNGTLVWKIENVSRLIQKEKSGVIDHTSSPYFYSSPNGYRMQLALYFSTNFVALYLHFLIGQFDEFLPATFHHRTTFMILDQSDATEKKHLTNAPIISRDIYADFQTKFAPRALILGTSVPQSVADPPAPIYLKEDALLIKAIVEPFEAEGKSVSCKTDDFGGPH